MIAKILKTISIIYCVLCCILAAWLFISWIEIGFFGNPFDANPDYNPLNFFVLFFQKG